MQKVFDSLYFLTKFAPATEIIHNMNSKNITLNTTIQMADQIDAIAKRHRRTRNNMLLVIMESIIDLEKNGKLDSWLLETSSEGEQS